MKNDIKTGDYQFPFPSDWNGCLLQQCNRSKEREQTKTDAGNNSATQQKGDKNAIEIVVKQLSFFGFDYTRTIQVNAYSNLFARSKRWERMQKRFGAISNVSKRKLP